MKNKFVHLSLTYNDSELPQKKTLLCSIFPSGVPWCYSGYSNTEISPYYQAILNFQQADVRHCAEERT